jgi:hypothetical protein
MDPSEIKVHECYRFADEARIVKAIEERDGKTVVVYQPVKYDTGWICEDWELSLTAFARRAIKKW